MQTYRQTIHFRLAESIPIPGRYSCLRPPWEVSCCGEQHETSQDIQDEDANHLSIQWIGKDVPVSDSPIDSQSWDTGLSEGIVCCISEDTTTDCHNSSSNVDEKRSNVTQEVGNGKDGCNTDYHSCNNSHRMVVLKIVIVGEARFLFGLSDGPGYCRGNGSKGSQESISVEVALWVGHCSSLLMDNSIRLVLSR